MSVIRGLIRFAGVLVLGTVLGGLIAGLADLFALGVISGTPLGPTSPSSPLAWTLIGVAMVEGGARRSG